MSAAAATMSSAAPVASDQNSGLVAQIVPLDDLPDGSDLFSIEVSTMLNGRVERTNTVGADALLARVPGQLPPAR